MKMVKYSKLLLVNLRKECFVIKGVFKSWAVAVHAFNPIIQDSEAGGSPWVRGQPGLPNKSQDSQGYTVKPGLTK